MPTTVKKTKYGTYTCQAIYYKDGKRRFKRFTDENKKEVLQAAVEFERTCANETFLEKNRKITIQEAAKIYLDELDGKVEASTLDRYRSKKKTIIDKMPPLDVYNVTGDDIQKFVDADTTHSPKTFKDGISILKSAVRMYRKDFNPIIKYKKISAKKKEILPSSEKIKELIKATKGTDFEIPLLLMVVTGCRMSELQGFQWGDIDWENGTITVNRVRVTISGGVVEKEHAKTAAGNRTISLPPTALKILSKTKGDQNERICSMSRDTIRLRLLKYEEAVGIKPFISPHDFRHYSVSLMHYAQVPKSFGMRRVGHITEKMYDEQYVNPIDDYERKFNNQVNEVIEDTFFK